MTQQELQALVELLSHAPMTMAEQLWVKSLLNRLQAQAQQQVAENTPQPAAE